MSKTKQPSPLDEIREANIPIWDMIGNYDQPSEEQLAEVTKELRAERDEWNEKQDKKES